VNDPIDFEDQRQARDHYRAVHKLIGEEDIAVIDEALPLIWMLHDTLADNPEDQELINNLVGLLTDITMPEGIGSSDATFAAMLSQRIAAAEQEDAA